MWKTFKISLLSACLGILTAGLIHFIWVAEFSGACVVPTMSTLAERTISHVTIRQRFSAILRGYLLDIGADSMRLFLYSPDLSLRIEHSSVVNPNSSQKVGTPSLAGTTGETYTSQKDAHVRGQCFTSIISKEKPGTYRAGAESAGVEYLQSCPVYANRNELTGYLAIAFESVPERPLAEGILAQLKSQADGLAEPITEAK